MPRLKAPADTVDGVFVGGAFFPLDAEGCIEVPEEGNYSQLGALGFAPVAQAVAAEPQPEPPKAD